MIEISGYFSIPLVVCGMEVNADIDMESGEIRNIDDVYVVKNGGKVASIPFSQQDMLNDLEDAIKDRIEEMYLGHCFDEEQEPWED